MNKEEQENGNIWLTQPQIIDSIIRNINIPRNMAPQQTPDLSNKILQRDAAAPMFDAHFNYWAVVGKINFMEKSTRLDIAYVKH